MNRINLDFLTDLEERIKRCNMCSLSGHGYATERVHVGKGKRVLIIGEAPGRNEEIKKRPFVGQSGKLLDEWIEYMHLDNYVITNAVKHRPSEYGSYGNIPPQPINIDRCKSILDSEIFFYKPDLIILIGKVAVLSLIDIEGINNESMGILIKKFVEETRYYHDIRTMIMYHPSYILRTRNDVRWILDEIRDRIEEPEVI